MATEGSTASTPSEAAHLAALESLCRVCGTLMSSHRIIYSCTAEKVPGLLQETFGIEVLEDNPNVHPQTFCNGCYTAILNHQKNKKKGKEYYNCAIKPVQWQKHTEKCSTCALCANKKKGGRPKKATKNRGRPPKDPPAAPDELKTHIEITSSVSFRCNEPLQPERFPSLVGISSLLCPKCTNVVDAPVETTCGHVVCARCLLESSFPLECPACSRDLCNLADVKSVSPVVKNILKELQVQCDNFKNGCQVVVPLQKLREHSSQCQGPYPGKTQELQPAQLTPTKISAILHRPLDHPLSSEETKAMSHLIRTQLKTTPNTTDTPYHLECRTGGQPICFMRVPRPRKSSEDACPVTVRNRTTRLANAREGMSGGKTGARRQLVDELISTDTSTRQEILREAGITPTISAGEGLAMKAELSLPWTRLRILKRWLKKWGVQTASEQKLRQLAQAVAPYPVEAEQALFTFSLSSGGEEFRMAPVTYVKDLENLLLSLLEENKKAGRLTWHDDLIPPNEVWIKLGGDKGGGSFKMSLQIANLIHPNSPLNTVVFCAFEASDTASNLHIALDRYSEQIRSLTTLKWESKELKLFLFGDLEFLFCLYGLSGPSGKHCCIWCVATKPQMQISRSIRGEFPLRTLDHLRTTYTKFQEEGRGNIKNAKRYYNVIAPHFFDIEPQQVCIPGLHISLGVFLKLYVMLENQVHELDVLVASAMGQTQQPQHEIALSPEFHSHVKVLREISALTEAANEAEEEADFLDSLTSWTALTSDSEAEDDSQVTAMKEEARAMRAKAQELNARIEAAKLQSDFATTQGPCVRGLEMALQEIGAQRQAYYGGAFVGNHVHVCCKDENIKILCGSVVKTTRALAPSCVDDATIIQDRFGKLFRLFANCHNKYNTAKQLTDAEITQLERDIKDFMAYYRNEFPGASITPKLHLLEDHVVPWIKKWKAGLGLLSEQGAESIHARFNSLKRTYNNIRNPVERMKRILKEHYLQIAPSNVAAIPLPATKKQKLE